MFAEGTAAIERWRPRGPSRTRPYYDPPHLSHRTPYRRASTQPPETADSLGGACASPAAASRRSAV